MQIRHLTFLCITFLTPVFSAPFEKTPKNTSISKSTTESFKNANAQNLENSPITADPFIVNKNNKSEKNLKRNKVKSENKKPREGKTENEKSREEETGGEQSKNGQNLTEGRNGEENKKSKSSLGNRRSFVDSTIVGWEETIKKKVNNEKNLLQGHKKRCKCKKKHKKKIKPQNDDISQNSSESDPTLNSKIKLLIPATATTTENSIMTEARKSYQTRRNNSGNWPSLDENKKKKKKCRRKKKKKIVPEEENGPFYYSKFDEPSGNSYGKSDQIKSQY